MPSGAHNRKPPALSIPCRLPVLHEIYTSNLDASLRPVALALAWFANSKGGSVRPALSKIRRMTCLGERTVQRRVWDLRELGVLELEDPEHGLKGGHGRVTRYRFNLERLAALPARSSPTL